MPKRTAPSPADYKLIFEDNKIGAAILDDLLSRFVRPPVLEGEGVLAVLKTYDRGGQRKPLDHILTQINRANGAPEDDEPPEVQT